MSRPSHESAGAASLSPAGVQNTIRLRVRYSETDQMGTFYNSRPLEWFECGRSELLRSLGYPYTAIEARGVFLPLVEAHVDYLGRARYDDLLEMTSTAHFVGRARLRVDARIRHADNGQPVVQGYTVHAFTDASGKAIRPPGWLRDLLWPPRSGTAKGAPADPSPALAATGDPQG